MRIYKSLFVFCFFVVMGLQLNAQSVGISNVAITPDASSIFEVRSINMGVLIPRIVLTASNVAAPVTSPATSLLIYNTATAGVSPNDVSPGYYYWDGAKWVKFFTGAESEDWHLLGNAGTSSVTNFLGTTDAQNLVFRTSNNERTRLESTGEFLIGPSGIVNYATAEGDLYVQDIIEVDNDIYLMDILYHGGDPDTYWNFNTDAIYINAGGVEMMRMYEGGSDYIVFNEGGLDVDFRIECEDETDLFFINGDGEGGVFVNSIGAISGDMFSVYGNELWNGSNPWLINGYNSYSTGGAGFFHNSSTSNGYNAIEGITSYSGSTNIASGVFGLAITSTTTSIARGVRGSTNNTNGVGVQGSRTGTTHLAGAGFGGLFYNDLAWTGNTYNVSDKKLKTNIVELEGAIDIVKNTKSYTYEWDLETYPYLGLHPGTYYGFIAQEVEEIVPIAVADKMLDANACKEITDIKMVQEADMIEVKMIDYIMFIPILTQAIKEQQEKIESLEQRIEALEQLLSE